MTAMNGSARQAPAPRASLLADGALAAALAAVLPVVTYFAAHHQAGYRPFDPGAVALVIGSAVALALRRRYPVAVLALVFGITLIYFVLGYADGPIWLALLIAYYTAATCGHRLAAGIAAVAGVAIFPWLDYLLRNGSAPSANASRNNFVTSGLKKDSTFILVPPWVSDVFTKTSSRHGRD